MVTLHLRLKGSVLTEQNCPKTAAADWGSFWVRDEDNETLAQLLQRFDFLIQKKGQRSVIQTLCDHQ